MLLEFLAVGSLWFFIFVGVFVIMAITSIINETFGWTWFAGVLFIALFITSGLWDYTWLLNNPVDVLIRVGIYLGAGLLWSMKEWYSFVAYEIKSISRDSKQYLQDHLNLKHHWGRITTWIVYFPFFVLAWIVRDPIKWLAQRFTFVYQGITNHAIKKAIEK